MNSSVLLDLLLARSTTCSTPGNWQIKWLNIDWPAVNAFHLTKSVTQLANQYRVI